MEASSLNLRPSKLNDADESKPQQSEIDQVSPVQYEVTKLKERGTLMKVLWGIGMQTTQNSISQIAHDDMAAWERISEECPSMRKENLLVAVTIMCTTLISIVLYLSYLDPQPPIGSLIAQHCTEVSFITSSLSVVLRAYTLFIVGKGGIVEALRAGRFGRTLFICVAAQVTLKIALVAMYIGICSSTWATDGPGVLTIVFIIAFSTSVGLDIYSFSARYLRQPSLGEGRT